MACALDSASRESLSALVPRLWARVVLWELLVLWPLPTAELWPLQGAANLEATHLAGPAPAQPQGGPSARAALVPPWLPCFRLGQWNRSGLPGPALMDLSRELLLLCPGMGKHHPSNTQLTVAQHNCNSRYKPGYLSLLGFTVIALNVNPLK